MDRLIKFLLFLLISSNFTHGAEEFLYNICDKSYNFTTNSTYRANLNSLLSSLSSNSTHFSQHYLNGFYNTSAGDEVYGLFLCRGDVSTETCRDCVAAATRNIFQMCPVQQGAIVWYDYCFLRYENDDFFTTVDDGRRTVPMRNVNNVTDVLGFNLLLTTALSQAAYEAAAAPSGSKRFAVTQNSTDFGNLYTLVQCTPDLSGGDCTRCLHSATGQIPIGSRGGRVLRPSCNFRFELYPFYNQTFEPPPQVKPPPLPTPISSEGKSSLSAVTIVAIAVPISVSAVLFRMGY